MEISVDLTFSPLMDEYELPIIEFINDLRSSGLTMLENPLSTQIYGEYDVVMNVLNKAMKKALVSIPIGLIYIKIVKTNRSDYDPNN